jgi:hypothetical protein
MSLNLFLVLLLLSVVFGAKAVWTARLPISARRQIVGPRARKLGWCMIATPLFTAASVALWILALRLLDFDETLAVGQGLILGIVTVLLVCAYVANRVRRYAVPIRSDEPSLDWSNVETRPSAPPFDFLKDHELKLNDGEPNESPRESTLPHSG